jgi:nucleoside-diphosphate-sugar epimerase
MSGLHVVFGAGPLGRAVAQALLAAGEPVRMVTRRTRADLPTGVESFAADVTEAGAAARACAGARVVYQCAQPEYHRWPEEFPALQRAILEGAAAAKAVLVLGDNLYMYGPVAGPIAETAPCRATTRKGRTRAAMAEEALAAHAAGRLPVVIGRGSDFFGPWVRASAMGERVFPAVVSGGRAAAAGRLDVPHTYTYIADFGRALVTLGRHESAWGRAWHVPNPETVTTGEFIRIAFEEAGTPPRMGGTGPAMMRIAGHFIRGARETVEMMYAYEKPWIVDDSRFVAAFGPGATPLREAIRRTVDWYREQERP